MKRPTVSLAAWTVAAAGLFALAWLNWRTQVSVRELRAALAEAAAENARGRQLATELGRRLDRAGEEIKRARSGAQATAAAAEAALRSRPGYAEVRRLRDRQLVARRYGDLRDLGLAPGVEEQLRALLVDRLEAPSDAAEAAKQQGLADGSREMALAVQQALRGIDAEIRQLIGNERYGRLQEAQTASAARSVVVNLVARDMASAGLSPDAAQMDRLTGAFIASQQADAQAASPDPGLPSGMAPWARSFILQSTGILNPQQQEFLRSNVILSEQTRLLEQSRASPH